MVIEPAVASAPVMIADGPGGESSEATKEKK